MDLKSYIGDREKHVGGLRTKSEKIAAINEEQERQANYHQNRATTLTISYLLYQVVLFGAVTNSASLRCHQWWVPFALSLIPAILYFAALLSALTSYDQIKRQLDMYTIEIQRIRGQIHAVENKDDAVLWIDGDDCHVMRVDGFVEFKRAVCIWTTVVALVGFTAVVLLAPRWLLCRR